MWCATCGDVTPGCLVGWMIVSATPATPAPGPASGYPGQRFGLPEDGVGAMARMPRRFLALLIDWAICQLIAFALFDAGWGAGGATALIPLAIFVVENVLLVSTIGTTIGHRVCGLQVVRVEAPGRRLPPGLRSGAIRSVLLALVVPAIVWNSDGRGFHDQMAKTLILRVR